MPSASRNGGARRSTLLKYALDGAKTTNTVPAGRNSGASADVCDRPGETGNSVTMPSQCRKRKRAVAP